MPAILAEPLIKWGLILLMIVAAGVTGFVKGISYEQMRQDAALSKAAVHHAETTTRIVDEHAQAQEKIRIIYRNVEKEVDRHAQNIDRSCTLAPDAIRLYNDSVAPEAADHADASPGTNGKDH